MSLPPTKLISPIPPFPIDCSLSAHPQFAMVEGPMDLASCTPQLADLLGATQGNSHLHPYPGAPLGIPNVLTPCGHHNGFDRSRAPTVVPSECVHKNKVFLGEDMA